MKPHKATEVRHHRHTNLGSGPDKSASLRQSVELCQDALPKVLCPRAIYSPLGGWDEVLRLVRAVAGIVSGFDLRETPNARSVDLGDGVLDLLALDVFLDRAILDFPL